MGSVRDDSEESCDAIRNLAERAHACALPLTYLQLGGLDVHATEQMLADALGCSTERVRDLALLIRRKTGSNPLLIQQFVFHLHGLGLLRNAAPEGWIWEDAAVAKANVPDSAVAFLVAKLQTLQPLVREILEFVSCIADEFGTSLLVGLSHYDCAELEPVLFSLEREGLLVPSPGGYRFVHDRVREAAQSMLADDARGRLHAQIAQLLLERLDENEREARILEIAEHLDRGIRHLPDARRAEAARLNLRAGRRALRDGAPRAARRFLSTARELWQEHGCQDLDGLGFELMLHSIECETLCGEYDRALELVDALERHALSVMQRAELTTRRIRLLVLTEGPRVGTQYNCER